DSGKVSAEVVGHGRHDKVRIIKMKRRKHYRRQAGHRQWYTEVKINEIVGG
ncbi:MAG: 50S ribosomal protein L21, partial [Pseudomonadales bacterium]